MRPALWSRDLERAHHIADLLDGHVSSGFDTATDRIAARAGIAALEGRTDEAIAGYREALTRYRSVGSEFEVARIGLDFVTLVGPDHPATREAAGGSRAIFERVRARPYLERLDAATARGAPGGSPAAAPSADAASLMPG